MHVIHECRQLKPLGHMFHPSLLSRQRQHRMRSLSDTSYPYMTNGRNRSLDLLSWSPVPYPPRFFEGEIHSYIEVFDVAVVHLSCRPTLCLFHPAEQAHTEGTDT